MRAMTWSLAVLNDPFDQILHERGIVLPTPPQPVGSYTPVMVTGNLVFVSGQIPVQEDQVKFKGKLGKDISVEVGQQAAKLCIINGLAQLKVAIGQLDRVNKIVKLTGFVNSDPCFTEHSKVVNGASDLLVDIFGERGKHARAAVGVNSLPMDSAVEIEFIAELKS